MVTPTSGTSAAAAASAAHPAAPSPLDPVTKAALDVLKQAESIVALLKANGLNITTSDGTILTPEEVSVRFGHVVDPNAAAYALTPKEKELLEQIEKRQNSLTKQARLKDTTSETKPIPGGSTVLFDPNFDPRITRKVALNFIEAGLISQDWPRWVDTFSPDATYIVSSSTKWQGKEKIRKKITSQTNSIPKDIVRYAIDSLIVEGNKFTISTTNYFKASEHDKEFKSFQNQTTCYVDKDGKVFWEEDAIDFMGFVEGVVGALFRRGIHTIGHMFDLS